MLKPVLHRLFVQPDEQADDLVRRAREMGIEVQLDKREKKATVVGTIVAIGSTAFREFSSTPEIESIQVGSKILYAKYAGAEVPNSDLIMLNDEDVIGVYVDE